MAAKIPVSELVRQRTAMVRLLPYGGRGRLALLVATVAVAAAIPPLMSLTTGAVIGGLPEAIAAGRDSAAARHTLTALAVAMALLVLQHLNVPLRGAATIRAVKQIDGWLVARVHRALHTPVTIDHLHDPTLLDDLALGGGSPTSLTPETPGGAAAGLVVRTGRWVSAIGSGLVLAAVSPPAAAFLLGAAILVRTRAHREHLIYVRSLRPLWSSFRRANYTASLATAPAAAKETRIFGLTDWLIERHEREWTSVTGAAVRERKKVRTWLARTQGLLALAHAGVFAYLGHLAGTGRISLGQLTAAISSSIGLTTLSATSHEDDAVDFGMASLDAVERIEARAAAAAPSPRRPLPAAAMPTGRRLPAAAMPTGRRLPAAAMPTGRRLPAAAMPTGRRLPAAAMPTGRRLPAAAMPTGRRLPAAAMPERGIRFENVSFTYPGAAQPALCGVDLELAAGQSTAIVGDNGAGKTTLIKLLARLHDPNEGRILVDGVDLRDLDPAGWRQRLAVIFQDFVRYELPATDNIGFGALALRDDPAALAAAIAQAGATEVVEHLPGGLATILSRRYPDGADLSGGEWQKVALARALLAVQGGARLLVLDEPTANLDVRAEAELFDRFLDLTAACTTILVSHRFSTVRRAGRICVLSRGGTLVEQGTHDQLMARNDRYAELFSLQAARFT